VAGIHNLSFSNVSYSDEESTCQDFILDTVEEFKFQSGAEVIDIGCDLNHSR